MVTTATVEAFSVAEAVAKVDEIHKAFGMNIDIDITILADADNAGSLSYAFPWLKNKSLEETSMAVGAIEFDHFAGIGNKPQKIASAAAAIENAGLMGASYKPILFVGTQPVRGINYWFFAEQTLVTNPPQKRIVKLAVNEFQGKFEIAEKTIKVINFAE